MRFRMRKFRLWAVVAGLAVLGAAVGLLLIRPPGAHQLADVSGEVLIGNYLPNGLGLVFVVSENPQGSKRKVSLREYSPPGAFGPAIPPSLSRTILWEHSNCRVERKVCDLPPSVPLQRPPLPVSNDGFTVLVDGGSGGKKPITANKRLLRVNLVTGERTRLGKESLDIWHIDHPYSFDSDLALAELRRFKPVPGRDWSPSEHYLCAVRVKDGALGRLVKIPGNVGILCASWGSGRTLIYARMVGGGHCELVSVSAGKDAEQRVIPLPKDTGDVAFSRNGQLAAVVTEGAVYLLETISGDSRVLIRSRGEGDTPDIFPQWSRDGRLLALTLGKGARRRFEVVRVADGRRWRLRLPVRFRHRYPAILTWYPDSHHLVLAEAVATAAGGWHTVLWSYDVKM